MIRRDLTALRADRFCRKGMRVGLQPSGAAEGR
jgi:hypothetical protein